MSKKVTEFVVDRAKWKTEDLPNALFGNTALRNRQGMQCCLGFLARTCGYKVKDIISVGLPYMIDDTSKFAACGIDPRAIDGAAEINDDNTLSRKEREARLKVFFAKRGIKIKFVGRAPRVAR